ncbi:MAG: DEAD/DEAH box helicase [Bacteroidota bacterium]
MTKFEEIGLHPDILRSIEELGFESPTEIQEQAIPAILGSDQDLIALAQTGTGKTAAFGLPLIQQVDSDNRHPQGLILCPTRELAIQIARDLESYSKYVSQLKIEPVYGGTPIGHQIRSLKKGVQIVVATPGRAIDLIGRGALNLSEIQWVVMDEADEMLNMGFQKDLDKILAETPSEKQTLLFSATMPPAISRITKKYMDKPGEISIGTRNSGSKNVTHEFYQVHARDRYEALRRIVAMRPDFYGIVFCRTRRDTKDVARSLSYDGYPSDAIHGDLSQVQRDEVMDKFRSKQIKLPAAQN